MLENSDQLDKMFNDLFNSNIHIDLTDKDLNSQVQLDSKASNLNTNENDSKRYCSVILSLNQKTILNSQITEKYEKEIINNNQSNNNSKNLTMEDIFRSFNVESKSSIEPYNHMDFNGFKEVAEQDLDLANLESNDETDYDYTIETIKVDDGKSIALSCNSFEEDEQINKKRGQSEQDNLIPLIPQKMKRRKSFDINMTSPNKSNLSAIPMQKITSNVTSACMRKKWINQLEYRGIKQKSSEHYTTFIYDWDDTLLCTSFLNKKSKNFNSRQSTEKIMNYLENLQEVVCQVLEKSLQNGKVMLITNAVKNWIDQSSNKWLPQTVEFLQKVEIISARQKFEHKYPKQMLYWKQYTFLELAEQFNTDDLNNIIVIGDSTQEIEGAKKMKELFSNSFLKTVKLKEMPHPEELINQLELILTNMDSIISKPKDLTIKLAKKD